MNPTRQLLSRLQLERQARHLPQLQQLALLDWHAEVFASRKIAWLFTQRVMKNTPLPKGCHVRSIKITCYSNLATHLHRVQRKILNQLYAQDTLAIGVTFRDGLWGRREWTLVLLKKSS